MLKLTRKYSLFIAILFLIAIAGCKTTTTTTTTTTASTTATTVTTVTTATTATTVTTATTDPDQALVNDAAASLILGDTTNVKSNLTLPTAGRNGTTITWSSSNTDVVANDGTVTRPANGDGSATVTLTATITLNNASTTKTFAVRVLEEAAATIGTIASIKENTIAGQTVQVQGIVTGLQGNSAYIQDGTAGIYIYTSTAWDGLVIGNKVTVTGAYSVYNGLSEIAPTKIDVVSTGNTVPDSIVYTNIADLNTANPQSELVTLNGVTITSLPSSITSGGSIYVTDGTTTGFIIRIDKTVAANFNLSDYTVGETINVTGNLGCYSTPQIMVLDPANITKAQLTDTQQVASAVSTINLPTQTGENLTLPTTIGNVTVAWTSSDTSIIADDGTVTLPSAQTDVTLTAVFTLNDATQTETYTITVLVSSVPPLTVAEAVASADGTDVKVEGVVVANCGLGYLVYGDGAYGFVYTNAAGDATVGDDIIFTATIDIYKGLVELSNPTVIQTVSSGNTLPAIAAGTIADLTSRTAEAATVTATVSIEGTNNNVYLTDSNGDKVQVYYKSTADYLATNGQILKAFNGMSITLPIFMYQDNTTTPTDSTVLFVGDISDIIVNTTLTATQANAVPDGTTANVEGVVVAIGAPGYFIYSGNGYAFVYTSKTATNVAVGDDVTLTITTDLYKGLVELSNPILVSMNTHNNTVPTLTDTTLSDLMARTVTAGLITVEISVEGTYNDVYLTDSAGNKVKVYYKSTDAFYSDNSVLASLQGDVVTLPVFMYQDGSVLFLGTASDITILSDSDIVSYVETQVSVPDTTTTNLTLPTSIFGVTITWSSDNTAVIANDGTVTVGAATTDVTLTATFTLPDATDTQTYTVTVPAQTSTSAYSDLIISEYLEGSSYNKAIEIYNGTGADVDLSAYAIDVYMNGATTPTTVALSGTLAAGDVYVIANSQASSDILALADLQNNTVCGFNGDDALALAHNGTDIDVINVIGTKADNGTTDVTLVRLATVTSDNTTFTPSEWDSLAKDSLGGLGTYPPVA